MKKMLTLIALVAIVMLVSATCFAAGLPGSVAGSLYQQEGTTADGPSLVNAANQGPATNASTTNWKYQYGAGWTSDVYAGANGWINAAQNGDMNVDIEADIEMYSFLEIWNNKVYFHIGDLRNVTELDKTATISGTATYNNGMYVGISFPGGTKDASQFEKIGTAYTGKIINGMKSDRDTWRAQNNAMDLKVTLSDGFSTDMVPANYGDGAHGTVTDTLWWLVNNGTPGTYNLSWKVQILPTQFQADGDYALDPIVVSAPVL